MNNKVKEIFKGALSIFAGFGITVMATKGIGMLTPETAGMITKLACKTGGYLLAGAAAKIATNEIEQIDKEAEEMKKALVEHLTMIETTEQDNTDDKEETDNADQTADA